MVFRLSTYQRSLVYHNKQLIIFEPELKITETTSRMPRRENNSLADKNREVIKNDFINEPGGGRRVGVAIYIAGTLILLPVLSHKQN